MSQRPFVPTPPHPTRRHEPLPEERPKPPQEEEESEVRLRAIMDDPAYAAADRDVDFLHRDETRGARLQLDYLKAELVLREHGIERCIVFFGSTRLREPDTARRELTVARRTVAAHPGNTVHQRALRLAERRMELARYTTSGASWLAW